MTGTARLLLTFERRKYLSFWFLVSQKIKIDQT